MEKDIESTEQIELATTLTRTPLDDDSDLTVWQAAKKYRKIMWYCVGLTSAILLYGYDYVIVGSTSAMPSFQSVQSLSSIQCCASSFPSVISSFLFRKRLVW